MGFQPVNIASWVGKLIWNIFTRFKRQGVWTNCHGAINVWFDYPLLETFFLGWATPEVVLAPSRYI